MICKYGFIVKAANYGYRIDNSVIETELFRTEIVDVSTDDEAVIVAKNLIKNGVQVIELCGGFGEESADQIISAVDSNVPIGFISFTKNEQLKLAQLINGKANANK